jgi:hypothetical protein
LTTVLTAIDMLPTFAQLAGARLPDDYQPDGESIVAAIKGAKSRRSNLKRTTLRLPFHAEGMQLVIHFSGARLIAHYGSALCSLGRFIMLWR